jgi:hypothetical protein
MQCGAFWSAVTCAECMGELLFVERIRVEDFSLGITG